MKTNFDDLPWHDAIIMSILIDRQNPGKQDTVRISVQWPDETESVIVFSECYALRAMMNFGVIAAETVLSAAVVDDRDGIKQIYSKWSGIGVNMSSLQCYHIETNTTGSNLFIYALDFCVQ